MSYLLTLFFIIFIKKDPQKTKIFICAKTAYTANGMYVVKELNEKEDMKVSDQCLIHTPIYHKNNLQQ